MDVVFRFGEDVGVGLEQGTQVASRAFVLALCDGAHHAWFGAPGEHADGIEQQLFALWRGVEWLAFAEDERGMMIVRILYARMNACRRL